MRCCLLVLAATALAVAADVELALTNGRTVRGELVSENEAQVVLRSRFPARGSAKLVETTYQKADILRRKEVPSPLQQYEERQARTPDTVPEQCTLAQWAYEHCLREQARVHALRVLAMDAENAWARRILDNCGYIEVAGAWIDEAEHFKANNLTRLDGEIVPIDLAEHRRAFIRARTAYETAKRKLDETRETATSRSASASAAETKAKEANTQVEALTKAIEQAEQAVQKAKEEAALSGEARRNRQEALETASKRLREARDQQAEAKRAADQAKRTASIDRAAADKAKAAIPTLEEAVAKAEAELKAAAAKLPADDPLLAQLSPAKPPGPAAPTKTGSDTQGDGQRRSDGASASGPEVRRLRPGAD